jgi:hypothetical protein
MPQNRQYTISLMGVMDMEKILVTVDGEPVQYSAVYDEALKVLSVKLPACKTGSLVSVLFDGELKRACNNVQQEVFDRLSKMQIGYELKERIYNSVCKEDQLGLAVNELQAMNLPRGLLGAISEVLFAE